MRNPGDPRHIAAFPLVKDASVEPREAALSESPESALADMAEATDRLREHAWMIAPMTSGVVTPQPESETTTASS